MAENERPEDVGGIFMIWSVKKYLLKPRMAPAVVNLKVLELETAKEILSEQFDSILTKLTI